MKKTLAILLSLALVICMIPATAATAFAGGGALSNNMITITNVPTTYTGKEFTPTVTVTNGTTTYYPNTDLKITWSKTVNGTAQNNYTGEFKDAATYTVTVEPADGHQTLTGSATASFTVVARDLSTVSYYIPAQEKRTDSTTLADSIKNTMTTKVIESGSKETVLDLKKDIKITVTGEGDTGRTAAITPAESNKNVTGTSGGIVFSVKNGISDYHLTGVSAKTYTGSAITQTGLSLQDSSNNAVNLSTNYWKLVYTNNVDAGTASVKAVGVEPYVGETEPVHFTINGAGAETAYKNGLLKISDIGNQVLNATPTVTVSEKVAGSWKNIESSKYNVTYRENSSAGTAYADVTFVNDYNYTGTISKAFNVVASDKNIGTMQVYYGDKDVSSSPMSATAYRYNGSSQPISSSIKVYKDASAYTAKNPLSTSYYDVVYKYQDTTKTTADKTVSTTSPVEAKVYSVYIVGKNGYAGEKYIGTYTIPQYNMSFVTVSVSMASATSVPAVTVRSAYENITFVKDKDYAVSYNTYASTGKVWVTVTPIATGNLTGSSNSGYYSIVSKSITSCTASFKDGKTSASYTGSAIPVEVVVKDGYYTTLTKNTHYTVAYKNEAGKTVYEIKDAGRYTIEISGMNGYTGTTYLYFTVTGNDISTYTVVLDKTSVDATGYSIVLPKVTKVYSGSTTLYSTNYTVSYQNAAGTTVTSAYAPGTYKVAVTGAGKYSGTAYATFTIVGKTQSITGVNSTYTVKPTTEAFKLTPKAAEGTFTYTSSDNTVATVSSTGVVTPLKAGRAKITIKTTGNTRYNPAEFSTVIKVYPTKAVITKKPWTTGKSKIKVRWNKQDNVTRYEVRYSRVKSFASGTYITKKVDAAQNDYTTQSTTIKNLQSGQKYYVKVRAVKEVYNDYGKKLTYYGEWSGWRTVYAK